MGSSQPPPPAWNDLGQPIGLPVPGWHPPDFPPHEALVGRYCRLEPLRPEEHCAGLWESLRHDTAGREWTYQLWGPCSNADELGEWLRLLMSFPGWLQYAVFVKGSKTTDPSDPTGLEGPHGVANFLNISTENGSIEIGGLLFGQGLKRTTAATEALFLMIQRAFQLGYRRCEWTCNSLNAPSCAAALRLGFKPEGVLRSVRVVKGRNRDTAYFSIVEAEWPALRGAAEAWLDPENFDGGGQQRASLAEVRARLCERG